MKLLMQLINGLQLGSIYALVALGYTMVYGIVKLINFAHGDIMMVGAYMAITATTGLIAAGLPLWLCILFAVLCCAVFGMLIERIAYRPLRESHFNLAIFKKFTDFLTRHTKYRPKERKSGRISALITAIGVSLFLQNLFMIIFSPNPKPFPNIFNVGDWEIPFGESVIKIPFITWFTILVTVLLMIGLQAFIKNARSGKAMRAVSEDPGAASLMGINVNRTISITFALGSALAAVAAVLYVSAYPRVDPYMGSLLGLKAFVAAVLGGIGVIPGAMLGGFLLGIVEVLTKGYISSQLSDAVVFGILILVLLVKPSGILGKNVREKV